MSAEIFFKKTGYNQGYGGSMHITDMSKGIMGMNGIVGASFYMAAGAAIRAQVRGTKQVSVAFFGDGAAASPYYFSAIRSCANTGAPVIFVNENNLQYMGVPMAFTVPTKYVSEYTKGLDIPHFLVDGNDIAAVHAATKEAVAWARAGKGPSMIEAITYRWYDHSGFAGSRVGQEGAMGLPYRTDDEVKQWMSRDPIQRFKTWLVAKNLANEGELTEDRTGHAGGRRRVDRVCAQEPASRSGGRGAAHLRCRRGTGDAVLQSQGARQPRERRSGVVGEQTAMAQKSYNYAQLEGLAQEMRANADMVFFYEYQVPTATLPTGEVLDLAKEFGPRAHLGSRLADRRALDRRGGDRRRGGGLEGGRPAAATWRRSTPSSTCRTRRARSGR